MKKFRIIGGCQDTRINGEDFALTPYLSLVWVSREYKVFGIGLCWGYYAAYIGIGINIPSSMKSFIIHK